ncbi:FecR domain-containing protein [Pseudomonas sp. REP124]|uniref:FecR domain-containing protein n=1 Tax=Pseudomonas sp. REP124 TaxID=2875731 RepID=UPI001CCB923B|nr:FecR domain-containing protein [Pseudomonas sp. REP124]MBZ9781577.1 FecR domain-containing protein [Pseudomonas sp. REP124]
MNAPSKINPVALEEAAEWLMRLSEGSLSERELLQWQQWRASNSECEFAWQRAETLMGKLGGLPPELAMPALDRPDNPQRRAMLGRLAALLALAPAGWIGWQLNERLGWTADYHAGIGERRELTLADGSQLTLNTDTSVDVNFDAQQRLIRVRRGEILVQTAADIQVPGRPFRVSTEQGLMQALGTRFSVREGDGVTRLAVLEGRVQIELYKRPQATPMILSAGQQTSFSASVIGPIKSADSALIAWSEGMLVADGMPLGEFAKELARYRHGLVRCDPAVAKVRVSGAFPLDDNRQALNMLVQTYPVKVSTHLGGYLLTISPA